MSQVTSCNYKKVHNENADLTYVGISISLPVYNLYCLLIFLHHLVHYGSGLLTDQPLHLSSSPVWSHCFLPSPFKKYVPALFFFTV